MRKYSFHPSKVPSPGDNKVPFVLAAAFFQLMMGFGGKTNAKDDAIIFPDDTISEI